MKNKIVGVSLNIAGGIKVIFASILLYHFSKVEASLNYAGRSCNDDDGNYTQGSVYQNNLNLLLSNLSSKAAVAKFYNLTSGNDPNKVYGLFNCRQDLSLYVCSGCVRDATRMIVQNCPLYGEAIVWYYECMVRYANRSIFSMYENDLVIKSYSNMNVSNYEEFAPILSETMDSLIKNAAHSSYFSTMEVNFTSSLDDGLYCLAQCTPDLDEFGCESCLKYSLAELTSCCSRSYQAMVFLPSCELRYARSLFYNETEMRVLANLQQSSDKRLKPSIIAAIAVSASLGLGLFLVVLWLLLLNKPVFRKFLKSLTKKTEVLHTVNSNGGDDLEDTKLCRYDFATLKAATSQFAKANTLGEGGFGAVYKGTLKSGQQVAIKRLSDKSGQGVKEFINEAHLVGKLQHRNLVRLLGYCSEQKEKLLVYEFLPNTCLDHVLFERKNQPLLGWETRYEILIGIARGIQYLHEDSRLTIIHRDLKPGNILLDKEMIPKIADFGTAKLFGDEQMLGNTSRVIGTHGYMAPEYLLMGEYSEKSDVYSFGVMTLEIVSGKKNMTFYQSSQKENLLGHAWRLWNEDRSFELLDPALYDKCSRSEVMKSIKVGMLCIQRNAAYRPTMGEVVLMFTGSVTLPFPLMPKTPDCDSEISDDSDEDQQGLDPQKPKTRVFISPV